MRIQALDRRNRCNSLPARSAAHNPFALNIGPGGLAWEDPWTVNSADAVTTRKRRRRRDDFAAMAPRRERDSLAPLGAAFARSAGTTGEGGG